MTPLPDSRASRRLLEAAARCASELLLAPDVPRAISRSLGILGEAVGVDRTYLFENHRDPVTGGLRMSQRFEWVAPGIPPQIENPSLQNHPYNPDFQRWERVLRSRASIRGEVRTFPEEERELLESQGIRSILVVPVFLEEQFWGFAGFDDCRRERRFDEDEESVLSLAAAGIGAALVRSRMHRRMEEEVRERTRDLQRQGEVLRQEVAERQAGERRLRLQNRFLESLHQISLDFLALQDPREVERAILERARDLFGARRAYLVSAETKSPGAPSPRYLRDVPPGETDPRHPWGGDLASETLRGGIPRLRVRENGGTCLGLPLLWGEDAAGALLLDLQDPGTPSADRLLLAHAFTDLAALSWRNASLHEALLKQLEEGRRTRAVLEESRERYRRLVDHAPLGIVRLEGGGRVVDSNAKLLELFDTTGERLADRDIFSRPGRLLPEVLEAVRQCQQTRRPRALSFAFPKGTGCRHLKAHLVPLGPEELLGVVEDVTDLVEAEKALWKRTEELSAASADLTRTARMKDEFLAHMSHELRTPLGAMLNLAEALAEESLGTLNEAQRRILQSIEECGRHFLSLIGDILDLSKVEAGRLDLVRSPLDVASLARGALAALSRDFEKKEIAVSLEAPEDLPRADGDPKRVRQILVNLLSNAIKFTPQGGRVGVEVLRDPLRPAVVVTVWDRGIGISPEDLERLFVPFVQGEGGLGRPFSGTGLGLSLVLRMVELHGGGLQVESAPGEGSRFTVRLPLAEEILEEPLAPPHGVPSVLLATRNLHPFRPLIRRLGREGLGVLRLRSPEEVPDALRQGPVRGVLVDWTGGGRELFRDLMRDPDLGNLPKAVCATLVFPGTRREVLAAGAGAFFPLPLDPEAVLESFRA